MREVNNVLSRLDKANAGLNWNKCKFAQQEVEWLGFKLTQDGVIPLRSKLEGILQLQAPKTIKQLHGLMGSAHQLNKFIPNLAQICHPFRTLLKQTEKFSWTTEHDVALHHLKLAVGKIAKNSHFNARAETRVTCDASKSGLGAVSEQKQQAIWTPIAFASRFPNAAESRYSTNELELLGVVWSIEHFKNYLLGRAFTVRTDHRALLSALSSNRGNKTSFSRLARWVDRLLPFQFEIEHLAGKDMGWADYLSRHPGAPAPPISEFDQNFSVSVIRRIRIFTSMLASNQITPSHVSACYINVHQSGRPVTHVSVDTRKLTHLCTTHTHNCSRVVSVSQIQQIQSTASSEANTVCANSFAKYA